MASVTTEFKVTDGGSVDAAIAKVEKLRNVLKETKDAGSGSGEKITAGAKAIKSAADAAESGSAKFQKATGALQNLAAATGNPLLMKGASMFNGLAAGLNKIESGALGAGKAATFMWTRFLGPIAVVVGAIAAVFGALGILNKSLSASSKYGDQLASSLDAVKSSTKELGAAALELDAAFSPEAMIKYIDSLDKADVELAKLKLAVQESEKATLKWSDSWDVTFEKMKKGFSGVLGILEDVWDSMKRVTGWDPTAGSAKAAAALEKKIAEGDKKVGPLGREGTKDAMQRAIDAKKSTKEKTGGKSAAEVALDATNKQLDATLKLKDAEIQKAQIAADSVGTYDAILASKIETATVEKTQVQYAKNMLEAAGNSTAQQAAALQLENDIAAAKNKTYQDSKKFQDEYLAKQREIIDAEINAAAWRNAFDSERQQLIIDTYENELRYVNALGLIDTNRAIEYQAQVDFKRQEVAYSEALYMAALEQQRLENEGKLSQAEITAKYEAQVSMVQARNTAIVQGIELQKQAALELERQRSLMEDMTSLAESMAKAFGYVGKALGSSLVIATKMQEQDKTYAKKKELLMKDEKKNVAEIAKLESRHTVDQINGISEIASSTKEMFAEKTAAHKAFAALERVTAAMSMALQAQQLAQTLATLPKTIAGGVSKLFEQGGWAGFAGAAAFLAMMASLGANSGATASAPKITKSSIDGSSGGVLGGGSDKSLANGIDRLNQTNYEMLRYNKGKMYAALVAIRDTIGQFGAAAARAGLASSGTEESESKKLLGLFGSSVKILASGLSIMGTYGQGVTSAKQYETVQSKKKFLGFSYSSKNSTKSSDLPDELVDTIDRLFKQMGEVVLSGAEYFNSITEQISRKLSAAAFDLSIDTKGMSTSEIMQALEAKVGSEISRIVGDVIPGFTWLAARYQQVGESSLDFLTRAAYTADNIMAGLESVGKAVNLGGMSSAEFALKLEKYFGSIEDFNDKISFYADNFLSESERLAPIQARVSEELARMGLSAVKTKEQFKQVVNALNLSTEYGRETYAALMNLAPAFSEITKEAVSLEEQLAELREKQLDLKSKITNAYESESAAMRATIDTLNGSISSLLGFKSNLLGGSNSTLTPAEKYALAKSEAAKVAAEAAKGNKDAASKLPSILENLLATSRVINASGSQYSSDFDYVQRLLDTTVSGLENQKTDAEKQLSTLEASYSSLNIIKEQTFTMADLTKQLLELNREEERLRGEGAYPADKDMKTLVDHLAKLRAEQDKQTKDMLETLKRGFIGVVTSAAPKPSTPKTQEPLINNPGYWTNYEATGGA